MRNNMVRNMAKCAVCGDIIESKYRHDFVQCICKAIAVDGGQDYMRRCGNPEHFDREFDETMAAAIRENADRMIEGLPNKKLT